MRLVILESPYAGEVEANVAYARAAVRDSLARGEAPIASHLLYTQPGILDDLVPDERAQGIAAGLAWRTKADAAVFYVDRGWSRGMLEARALYDREGKPYEERTLHGHGSCALPMASTEPVGAGTATALGAAMIIAFCASWIEGNPFLAALLGLAGLH